MQVSRQANCHRGAVSVLRVLLCPPFPTLWLCGIARNRSHPRPQAHYWQRAVAARSIVQRPRSSEECSANRPVGVAALRATADPPSHFKPRIGYSRISSSQRSGRSACKLLARCLDATPHGDLLGPSAIQYLTMEVCWVADGIRKPPDSKGIL
jgi:hypothetical protein